MSQGEGWTSEQKRHKIWSVMLGALRAYGASWEVSCKMRARHSQGGLELEQQFWVVSALWVTVMETRVTSFGEKPLFYFSIFASWEKTHEFGPSWPPGKPVSLGAESKGEGNPRRELSTSCFVSLRLPPLFLVRTPKALIRTSVRDHSGLTGNNHGHVTEELQDLYCSEQELLCSRPGYFHLENKSSSRKFPPNRAKKIQLVKERSRTHRVPEPSHRWRNYRFFSLVLG